MKFKLDENLGSRCMDVLQAAGHEVATVVEQAMSSADDDQLIHVCAKEGRALVTLDLDFSNPLIYPRNKYAGIAVLRLPAKPPYAHLVAAMKTLTDALKREDLLGKLWTVEPGRIRVYQQPDLDD